jgi:hypothetical protein
MEEIGAEIRSLISKYKIDSDLSTNLNVEDFTSALIVLINRERREVCEYATTRLSGRDNRLDISE